MSHYPDLSPGDYFRTDTEGRLLAVGWLEPGAPYPTGEADRHLLSALVELLADPWQPGGSFRGYHSCGFCRRPREVVLAFAFDGRTVRLGVSNLFVPAGGCVYAAPSLVLHYMAAHDYAPPEVFREAVLACPEMRSAEYMDAVRKNGPSAFAEMTG